VDEQKFHLVVAIAAVAITLSFIIQMAMLIAIYRAIRKLNRVASSVQEKVEPVIAKTVPVIDRAEPMMAQLHSTVTNASGAIDKISRQAQQTFDKVATEIRAASAAISTASQEIAKLAQRQAEQVSQTVEQSTAMIQKQVNEIDRLLARTQDRIESTTIEVQTTLLRPLRELSAMIAAIKRTFEVLMGHERKQIDRAYQDEEMFI
jgi:ABC-type transporter Mla subunit MlaD